MNPSKRKTTTQGKRLPIVAVIMGSKSDTETMMPAKETLEQFGVVCEWKILSAHRTPDEALHYAETALARGVEVVIAGAGGAAHLAGVIAAKTPLPVIGVPIKSKSLNGLDSLLSMVQMPSGVPVATVAIDGAANAALLALRILGLKYPSIMKKMNEYRDELRQNVLKANG
ncbi:MAG: 5-(carboxyamino)imidazole ribonucleotide mutase [Ignavibacteriae bacterium]|nr:5-(carboxyamino)imidazole ribonucleotide mutase [Ignavibacteriota bacterium]